jgi:hypothetical protein
VSRRRRFLKDEYEELLASAAHGLRPSEAGWLRLNCPLCELRVGKGDKKRSMGLSVTSFRFECYRCGATGRLSKPLDEFVGFEVAGVAPGAPPPTVDEPEGYMPLAEEPARSALVFEDARDYLAGLAAPHRAKPRPKPIPEWLIKEAGIGAVASGYWAHRIIMPIFDLAGEWANFSSRSYLADVEKAYLYPKGGRRGVLYNHVALLEETDTPVLVVEGCFDALAHWPHAVAVLGKPTHQHVEALATCQRPVVFALDGDAWEEAWALTLKLRARGQRAAYVKLAPRVDPDEIPTDTLLDVAREALDAADKEMR